MLSYVWNAAMRLLHPIAPFISEEVWLALPHDGETIVTANWPDPLEVPDVSADARDFTLLQRTVERVRNLRAEFGLHPRDRRRLDVPANVSEEMADLLALLTTASIERARAAGEDSEEALAAIASARTRASCLRSAIARRPHICALKSTAARRNSATKRSSRKPARSIVAKEREKLAAYRGELARVEAALDELKEPA